MPSFCQITAMGHLTKDPDYRHTSTGSAVCELSIAYNRKSRNGQDEVTYIKIVVWGKQADHCRQYLSKGSCIHVTGYLKQERRQDRNTGKSASEHKIIADQVVFIPAGNGQRRQNTTVDPQYGPDVDSAPPVTQSAGKPRFYGDTGDVSVDYDAAHDAGVAEEDQDIPF